MVLVVAECSTHHSSKSTPVEKHVSVYEQNEISATVIRCGWKIYKGYSNAGYVDQWT